MDGKVALDVWLALAVNWIVLAAIAVLTILIEGCTRTNDVDSIMRNVARNMTGE